jgi:hypothetical protein
VFVCIVFYIQVCIQMSNKMQQWCLGFIARSLYMFRVLSAPIARSTITAVDNHWYNTLRWIVNFGVTSTLRTVHNRAVGHITVVMLSFSTSALGGGGWSAPRSATFTPRKDPVARLQEAEWAPGPVLTCAKNLAPTGIRFPDRPARSQPIYRLSYPAHACSCNCHNYSDDTDGTVEEATSAVEDALSHNFVLKAGLTIYWICIGSSFSYKVKQYITLFLICMISYHTLFVFGFNLYPFAGHPDLIILWFFYCSYGKS